MLRLKLTKPLGFRAFALVLLILAPKALMAQCSVLDTCGVCNASVCFADDAAKKAYEKQNKCTFPEKAACDGKEFNTDTQCCVVDAKTKKNKIVEKQSKALSPKFDWDTYKAECTGKMQSESPPDGLWQSCRVGQRHSADDAWPVQIVEAPKGNTRARTHCIDGCSTPPNIVNYLYSVNTFIFEDKDNPVGKGPNGYGPASSFFPACANHDRCYQACDDRNQLACDNNLLAEMNAVCDLIPEDHITTYKNLYGGTSSVNTQFQCFLAATRIHNGLRLLVVGGVKAFAVRRQQYCQCCK